MFNRQTWTILALAALAALIGGLWQHGSQPAPTAASSAMIGQHRPDLALDDLQGRPHRLSEYQGERLVLNFWASWCAPCLEESPRLARAQARGTHIVGIAMDQADDARRFLAAHPSAYPQLLGQLTAPSSAQRLGDADGTLPFSVLLDGRGQILAAHAGALDEARLRRWGDPAETDF